MTDLATPVGTSNGRASHRQVRRRRPLPGGRAVVGGFLVAASAVGVFAAWTASTSGPSDHYVVVRDDVAVGDRIGRSDLALVALDLPAAQRRLAFTDIDLLVGATAVAALAEGQLVQSSDVAKPVGAPERAQMSMRIDSGDAVGGELRSGDVVDVIATYTSAGTADTSTIARGAIVVKVIGDDRRVGSSGAIVVVLAVRPAELEPIAAAVAAGHVSLARMTGVER